ncbi:MAG: CARDB domain-containing protein, partial [Candidatus Hodarchaeota archaeon]
MTTDSRVVVFGLILVVLIAFPFVAIVNICLKADEVHANELDDTFVAVNYNMEVIEAGTWFDAKANGINLGFSGDDVSTFLAFPFNISFYDMEFDFIYIGDNGYLSFVDPTPTDHTNDAFPSADADNAYCVASYWDDLLVNDNVYAWNTSGSVVIQYDNVVYYPGSLVAGTFQVVFHDDSTIDFTYLEMLSTGTATVGLNYGDELHYNSYPHQNLEGVNNLTLRFTRFSGGDELAVSIEGPGFAEYDSSHLITATVFNYGDSVAGNIDAYIYLEGDVVTSLSIPSLAPLANISLTYLFGASDVGKSNLTATIERIPDEFTYSNNQDSLLIVVFESNLNYAIFQNSWPWGYTSTADALSEIGIPFDIYSSDDMGLVNLSKYSKVIISPVQNPTFYLRISDNMSWIENYVLAGGILEIHTYSFPGYGWVNGLMPGGALHVHTAGGIIQVDSPWHPLLTYPFSFAEAELGLIMASHLENLSEISQIILSTQNGPVLVESSFGEGSIIYTTQPLEYTYVNYQSDYLFNHLLYNPIRYEHDIFVNIEVSMFSQPGDEILLNITVGNLGLLLESDIDVDILIDGKLLTTKSIDNLPYGSIWEESISWTPYTSREYEATASVDSISGEVILENNMKIKNITIRPLIGNVLWDIGHGCQPSSDFNFFSQELLRIGYIVEELSDPINASILEDSSALVCVEPTCNYWNNETDAIQEFVLNGGGLFVVGDDVTSSLTNLTMFAGIEWIQGVLAGSSTNITPHEITVEVETAIFGTPLCWLNLADPAIGLVYIQNNFTMVAAAEVGMGRVAAIADDDCF